MMIHIFVLLRVCNAAIYPWIQLSSVQRSPRREDGFSNILCIYQLSEPVLRQKSSFLFFTNCLQNSNTKYFKRVSSNLKKHVLLFRFVKKKIRLIHSDAPPKNNDPTYQEEGNVYVLVRCTVKNIPRNESFYQSYLPRYSRNYLVYFNL